MKQFLAIFKQALEAIREPRLFETERGYQGALLAELQQRLIDAAFPGDPMLEQEYQKTAAHHGITIRPDLIIHIPFERGRTTDRREGNYAAIEIKRRATPTDADGDFDSLIAMKEKLGYPTTVFLNVDASKTYAERCPSAIAAQTACFAVRLQDGEPLVLVDVCG